MAYRLFKNIQEALWSFLFRINDLNQWSSCHAQKRFMATECIHASIYVCMLILGALAILSSDFCLKKLPIWIK